MKATDNWKIWRPLIKGLLTLINVVENQDEFAIFMYNENQKLKVTYKSAINSYKITPASYKKKTIDYFEQKFNRNTGLFLSDKSDYKSWVEEELMELLLTDKLMHQMYITTNYIIEVINEYGPEISVVENSQNL